MKYALLCITLSVAIATGCAPKKITEADFTVIWNDYIKAEFEENFDEKQSSFQRKQIIAKVSKKYGYDPGVIRRYMKIKYPLKYRSIFED